MNAADKLNAAETLRDLLIHYPSEVRAADAPPGAGEVEIEVEGVPQMATCHPSVWLSNGGSEKLRQHRQRFLDGTLKDRSSRIWNAAALIETHDRELCEKVISWADRGVAIIRYAGDSFTDDAALKNWERESDSFLERLSRMSVRLDAVDQPPAVAMPGASLASAQAIMEVTAKDAAAPLPTKPDWVPLREAKGFCRVDAGEYEYKVFDKILDEYGIPAQKVGNGKGVRWVLLAPWINALRSAGRLIARKPGEADTPEVDTKPKPQPASIEDIAPGIAPEIAQNHQAAETRVRARRNAQ